MQGNWMLTFDNQNWQPNEFGEFTSKEQLTNFIYANFEEIFKTYQNDTGITLGDFKTFVDTRDRTQTQLNGFTIYIGQITDYTPEVDAAHVIEQVGEQAFHENGDAARDFLNFLDNEQVNDLKHMLNETFNTWMQKHQQQPDFYAVKNIEEIDISFEQAS